MKLYHCNSCGQDEKMDDDEALIIHICGSGDVDRICPICRRKYDSKEQKGCHHCKAEMLALAVVAGKIGLTDAMLKM